ncbi:MAG: DUF3142 domain-containing protein [Acidobacteria bacterium]|nr:DUF3142 domain-containing protein [Acidobacteriota bacterium]
MHEHRHRRGWWRGAAALGGACAVALASVAWHRAASPRAWRSGEVPVAFWTWRDELPADEAVEGAAREARAGVLFARAGQLHAEGPRVVVRVRAPRGRFPRALPVHLVYNATRTLLASFGTADARALNSAVAETFAEDSRRAASDGARVAGLQLDLDVPTRLLPRYAALLRDLRPRLPRGASLSITGLPTWMGSPALDGALAEVDFWIPQFYGSRIPERLSESVPVASHASVADGVERARRLGRPFYAGLAAYGYAAHYAAGGALVELRGDLDPARVASDPRFELIESRAFDPAPSASAADAESVRSDAGGDASDPTGGPTTITGTAVASHWRYVFRAREDASIDGLHLRAGESLMFDAPTAEALRAAARAARVRGGARLLGLCLFRLPGRGDETTLTLRQIAAALDDRPAETDTKINLSADAPGGDVDDASAGRLTVSAANEGAGGALLGEALSVTVGVPAGRLRGVISLEGFTDVETLCGAAADGGTHAPCGARRANVLRLTAPAWRPGAQARAVLSVGGVLPTRLRAAARVRGDDGRVRQTTYSPAIARRAARVSAARGDEHVEGVRAARGVAPAEEKNR